MLPFFILRSRTCYHATVSFHPCSISVLTAFPSNGLLHLAYFIPVTICTRSAEAVLPWGRARARAPRFTCCLQIQKLADRSDVISEIPKRSKI